MLEELSRDTPPSSARILLIAVIGTQILPILIAASGLLMHPPRWDLIALAWGTPDRARLGSTKSCCSPTGYSNGTSTPSGS